MNASQAERIAGLGTAKWLDSQLHPTVQDDLPAPVAAAIQAMPISREPVLSLVSGSDAMNKAVNALTDPSEKAAAQKRYQASLTDFGHQAASRSILRDLYAPSQLREVLTWFWLNHFNVHLGKSNLRVMVGDYEDRSIRPHVLGRFRDLLGATLHSPAMLRYLDNADNSAGHINENYAREIMELHTMGVGSGYSQKDVQELARILTGVGIDAKGENPRLKPEHAADFRRDGMVEFNPNRHDYGDKLLLGHVIHGSGPGEVDEALDILASQPSTARRVSLQLARYFVGDKPPDRLVGRMAQAFLRRDGDLSAVMATMIASPEFSASLGTKFKDPAHYVLSAVRLAYDGRVVTNTRPIEGWLNRLAEGLYNHQTPDGYPLAAAAWDGPGQMALRFEIARTIAGGAAGLFRPDGPPPAGTPPASVPDLRQSPTVAVLLPTRSKATLAALGQAVSAADWNTLFFASPEFMRR